ncbi:hypothetical protein LTS10_010361 [Elasticomyces elasticus]|nr:hypothetical protein LTS10_010361 [Elasticomyces elasticus]
MALSRRGAAAAAPNDAFMFWSILSNLWNPSTNPNGFVMLGLAENNLMHDSLAAYMRENHHISTHGFTYGDGSTGSKRLKIALSQFLSKHLHPVHALEPQHIVVTNGCSSALEHLAWAFADPGDGFLLGQPFYGTFIPDFTLRAGARIIPVPFKGADPTSVDAIKYYEDTLLAAKASGQRLAGLILCNPHNPLGRCYPREVLIGLMRLCQKYQIHLISDEIYALSVWRNDINESPAAVPFESCLSIDLQNLIDPSLVHVVWGMSKDFGANGIRLGAIISQSNIELMHALIPVALYSSCSSLSEATTCTILEDSQWVESYVEENHRKLAAHYRIAAEWAEANDIEYARGANAAFFLWVNLGRSYRQNGGSCAEEQLEAVLAKALLEHRVFLAAGKNFGAEEIGWFRIVFSHERSLLEQGLKRIVAALSRNPA